MLALPFSAVVSMSLHSNNRNRLWGPSGLRSISILKSKHLYQIIKTRIWRCPRTGTQLEVLLLQFYWQSVKNELPHLVSDPGGFWPWTLNLPISYRLGAYTSNRKNSPRVLAGFVIVLVAGLMGRAPKMLSTFIVSLFHKYYCLDPRNHK